MVGFIDANRDELGVEHICKVLQMAPSTYYAAKSRPLSARAMRDAVLKVTLLGLWRANYEVYGIHKLWKAARRAGEEVGRRVRRAPGRPPDRPPVAIARGRRHQAKRRLAQFGDFPAVARVHVESRTWIVGLGASPRQVTICALGAFESAESRLDV
jgi:hypothetical protein